MNYKTTLLGVATILGAISNAAVALFDASAATNPDWALTLAALTSGFGLVFAQDAKR
jgi:hypothetical protein